MTLYTTDCGREEQTAEHIIEETATAVGELCEAKY
jgi:hypothetical protein